MIANPDNRHKKREREKTGSGHPQPHCALSGNFKVLYFDQEFLVAATSSSSLDM